MTLLNHFPHVYDAVSGTPADEMRDIVDAYETLRRRVYDVLRQNNGQLLKKHSSLRNEISEKDLSMDFDDDSVDVYGTTRGGKWFSVTIPLERI